MQSDHHFLFFNINWNFLVLFLLHRVRFVLSVKFTVCAKWIEVARTKRAARQIDGPPPQQQSINWLSTQNGWLFCNVVYSAFASHLSVCQVLTAHARRTFLEVRSYALYSAYTTDERRNEKHTPSIWLRLITNDDFRSTAERASKRSIFHLIKEW